MTEQRWEHLLTAKGLRMRTPVRVNSRPVVNELLGITGKVWKRLPCQPDRRRCGSETMYSWELNSAGLFELLYVGSGASERANYVLVLGPPWSAFKLTRADVLAILRKASRPIAEVVKEVLQNANSFRELV